MRHRRLFVGLAAFSLTIIACSLASGTTPAPADTQTVATPTETVPPIAPTQSAPGTPEITVASPTSAVPTPSVTATLTSTATAKPTNEPTTAPATKAPPPSTGLLDFTVSLVGCQLDPGRQGGVFLSFKIEATGGNGVYTYFREGHQVAQVSDRPATKGTAVVDAYVVKSGDGQSLEKKFNFPAKSFPCP